MASMTLGGKMQKTFRAGTGIGTGRSSISDTSALDRSATDLDAAHSRQERNESENGAGVCADFRRANRPAVIGTCATPRRRAQLWRTLGRTATEPGMAMNLM